ncbi:hypothetical protein ACVWWG_007538 [Bradyrhizobium sp. LB7.2]
MAPLRRRYTQATTSCAARQAKHPTARSTPSRQIFLFIRISGYRIESHPNPAEGRIAIVTNAGWDVVDAGGVGARMVAGRITP